MQLLPNVDGAAIKFGMAKKFHPTQKWVCDYLCLLGLKLTMQVKVVPWNWDSLTIAPVSL